MLDELTGVALRAGGWDIVRIRGSMERMPVTVSIVAVSQRGGTTLTNKKGARVRVRLSRMRSRPKSHEDFSNWRTWTQKTQASRDPQAVENVGTQG